MAFARKFGWSVMLLFAMLISAYSIAFLLVDDLSTGPLKQKLQSMPWAMYAHLGGGAVALLTGVFQFNSELRSRFLTLHRNMGRIYLVSVFLSGGAGLVMATVSDGGLSTHFGFGLLAVLWLISSFMAYLRVRQKDIVNHRRWMIRSYSLTLAAVTLRLWIPILSASGAEFESVYLTVSWLAWVPNLVIAEWVILRPRR
jgi:uncharacterized membrane protein